jgi:hypothetical protein
MTKKVLLQPRFPIHIFGAREGGWPEIGPGPTEVTEVEATDAAKAAHELGVELDVIAVDDVPLAVDTTGEPVPPTPVEPSRNASTEEWRAYAEALGLDVPDDANRTQIQLAIQADQNKGE